ncbi:MAG TPA: ATP-binding protein [Ramlibacter sp.]|jgi:signal transduction histidine kinase/CheY-like chemotaxis protein|uniref:hybrid sensor histidine kinase/response regulator n=1 Tax=Ramlibacter sp. TaxID=1917967 RepID=UPI002D4D6BCF|nr:ATP-binding protein [Ramlibacter sp.]HZY19022.1 ATP-binding protein [Ramlibacter sp.]
MDPRTDSPAPTQRPPVPLRRSLVAVILLALLPMTVLVCAQLLVEIRSEQARIEADLARSAAALSQAVGQELDASLDALAALSHADVVRQGRPEQLERMLRQRPLPRRDWTGVFLLDAGGAPVFDTSAAAAQGGDAQLAALHEQVARSARPAVSGLVPGAAPHVLVAMPLLQGAQVRQVLGARVPVGTWQRITQAASRPAGGEVLLLDAQRRPIAGTLPGPSAGQASLPADAPRQRPPGVLRTTGTDRRPVYAAWQPLPTAGWEVQVQVPARPIDAAHRRAILGALSAIAGTLLLGALLATLAARRISRPLQTLATQGHAGLPGRVDVQEIAMLRDALREATRNDERVRRELEADIGQRRRVEGELLAAHEQLQAQQRLMELAQEAGHVGFFHYAFDGDTLTWTAGHCKLFGVPALDGGTLGHWLDRIDAADRDRVEREFWTACALRRETATIDYAVSRPDQRLRWLSSRLLLRYRADGAASQATGVSVDMTDQREAEIERIRLTERALAARQEAEAASRAKDEFLSMLGHELRNPLGAVSAAVDVLEAAPAGSAEAAEARSIIGRQTRNLAHVMNDLLDVGRVIAGRIVLARQPVELAAVFDRVRRTLELTGASTGHQLALDVSQAWVEGDAVRLEQVMTNLVTNAIKYTPPGGRIEVRIAAHEGQALFEVRDSGVGIPADLLPRVFDLFVQGERPLDRGAGGLGIGLTLVRRLVDLHGGTVGADSSARGSRFTVRLPGIAPPARHAAEALPLSRRRRVLVIDDNQDVLAALRSKLELDGHTVATAADGIDGLSRLLRTQPEVSIVDIGLPGMTGYEVARHARAAGYAGRMIALSGYGQDKDVRNALVAGFDAYLVKPVERTQLRASLNET